MTPEGELVFGFAQGVTVFNPDRVSANRFRPPVVVTDFLLFNQPVVPSSKSPLQRPIWATGAVTLNNDQSIFTLGFASLSYVRPQRNRYRYKLENLEKDWNEVAGDRRTATYTSLPPGKYVFRVQGSNNDLLWNETGVRLGINVLPPWWATWWFRSLMGLAFVSLILRVYTLRVHELKRREKVLKVTVRQRTAELTEANQRAEEATAMKSMFLAN